MLAAAMVASAGAWAAPAFGLTDEDIYSGLRFTGSSPGARAVALGKSTLALVDDATAVSINPARLAAIGDPQIAFDLTFRNPSAISTDSGFIEFDPTINPFAGSRISTALDPQTTAGLGFIGYAHPLQTSRPLVLGFAREESLNLELDAGATATTVPLAAPVTPEGGDEVLRISEGHLRAHLDLYEAAVGWKISPGLSVGGTLVAGKLDLDTMTTGSLADPLQFTTVGMVDPRFTGSTAEPLVKTRTDGSDVSFGFTLGVQYRPHATVSLATVYHRGPTFEVTTQSEDLSSGKESSFTNRVKLPDVASFGVAWTPFSGHRSAGLRSLTFTGELDRMEFADLADGMRGGENVLTRSDFIREVSYDAENVTERRFGVEYRHPQVAWTLALRGGVYTEHGAGPRLTEASGDQGGLEGQSEALERSQFFDGAEDRVHGTAGVGALLYQCSFNVSADVTEGETAMVASFQYNFR